MYVLNAIRLFDSRDSIKINISITYVDWLKDEANKGYFYYRAWFAIPYVNTQSFKDFLFLS